jgi:hypothetical protein
MNLANLLPPLTRHHRCAEDLYQALLTAMMPTLTLSSMQQLMNLKIPWPLVWLLLDTTFPSYEGLGLLDSGLPNHAPLYLVPLIWSCIAGVSMNLLMLLAIGVTHWSLACMWHEISQHVEHQLAESSSLCLQGFSRIYLCHWTLMRLLPNSVLSLNNVTMSRLAAGNLPFVNPAERGPVQDDPYC